MEILAIVLSALAVVVSFVTFYMQFVHVVDHIVCTVIGLEADEKGARVQLAISNGGNRSVLLKDGHLSAELPSRIFGGIHFIHDERRRGSGGPQLIAKGEIISRVLKLERSERWVLSLARLADNRADFDPDAPVPIYAHLHFVNGSGRMISTKHQVLAVQWAKNSTGIFTPEKESWKVESSVFENFPVI